LEEDVGSLEGDFKSDFVHDLEPLNPAMPPQKSNFLHLQQMMQGAATRRTGEARTSRMPKPAKIPIT